MKRREESCGVSQSISVFFFVKNQEAFFRNEGRPLEREKLVEVDDLRAQKWPTEQTPIFTRKNKNERW
jgi:hypothetical protein